ncbi:T9SS type A sorting domain-containing protein [Bacteroidales bacterium OttesenSCG-928-B11]|nr:T9SS type A sorting domain-containing protein [Bacteroidales bacterium OttesenSCG-928-E04]MDL2312371.1 T9SS type A sorting domain-containing protein [Bacteroidales bacterium OttesenSCG-928-B11]
MKKASILFIFASFIHLFFVQPTTLQAQTWPPTGMNGDGSSDSPWEISTVDHLATLSAYVNTGNGNSTLGKYYILMNDLDLANWEETPGDACGWVPIGNGLTNFQGNFNGAGKTIYNLTINRSTESFIGLFGYVYEGVIQNIGIENCNIIGGHSTGGLIGHNNRGSIHNSYASGNVTGSTGVGVISGSFVSASINNSYANGTVEGDNQIGGLIGSSLNSTIINCYSLGNASGNSYIGGLIGDNSEYSNVKNSYSSCNVSGKNYIGGLLGWNDGSTIIHNCIAANSSVIATQRNAYINRISGRSGSILYNSYALKEMIVIVNGSVINRNDDMRLNGTSKGADTLKSLYFYITNDYWQSDSPWSIDLSSTETWTICNHSSLPHLSWQEDSICPKIFVIASSSEGYGKITPLGFITLDSGENKTFTFTPNSGDLYFYIDSVLIDGNNNVNAVSNGYYTFNNISSDHTIHAIFNTTAHTITAIAKDNGVITPSGNVLVNPSNNKQFIFKAIPGYAADSLFIDGIYTPDSIAGGSYTFNSVTQNHTIRVSFKLDFCGGNGTESNPYQICTVKELASLAAYVNAGNGNSTSGKYYILMNDLDLANWEESQGDTCGWKAIGDHSKYSNNTTDFQGNFNGAGKKILNLAINRPTENYIGLFGHTTNSTIQNLGIENYNIQGYNYVGGLVGLNGHYSTINSCYTIGNASGHMYIGGLVGDNLYYSTLKNSYSDGSIKEIGMGYAGGLTGANSDHSSILNCYSTCNVKGSSYLGGISGTNGTYCTIQNCIAINDSIISFSETDLINRITGNESYYGTNSNNYAQNNMIIIANDETITRTDDNINGIGLDPKQFTLFDFYNTNSNWHAISWNINLTSNAIWKICDSVTLPFFHWEGITDCPKQILASAGKYGSITPSGLINVDYGGGQTFTITPYTGFYIDSVFIDGIYNENATSTGTYSFTNNIENHTIHAIFSTDFLTIETFADANGSISPAGIILLNIGDSQAFAFKGNPGYTIDSLFIDDIYTPDSIANESYTFNNTTSNHTIRATFKLYFCGGTGTESNPYQICTASELASLAAYINAGYGDNTVGKYYILMNDIDLTDWAMAPGDTCGWKPIGDNSTFDKITHFQGDFDGNNFTIYNLSINRPTEDYIGLFGILDKATVRDLHIENCDINGYWVIGALASYSHTSSITDVSVTGTINGKRDRIGGLVGYNYNSAISNSSMSGDVNGDYYIGGLVGYNDNSTIIGCHSEGNVSSGYNLTGGLVGYNLQSTITNCHSSANVSGGREYSGGLVGSNYFKSIISNCYATGDVSGEDNTGGLVGGNWDIATIINSYATGNVNGKQWIGGIAGFNFWNAVIANCYATGNISGYDMVGGITGMNYHTSTIQNTVAANTNVSASNNTTSISRIFGFEYVNNNSYPANYYHNNYALANMTLTSGGVIVTPVNNSNESGTAKDMDTFKKLDFYNTGTNWRLNTPWDIAPDTETIWTICNDYSLPFFRWQQNLVCPHYIIASAGNHGIISPSGTFAVEDGDDKAFSFTPNTNYKIDSVFIDGIYNQHATAEGSYTFANVSADHTIHVTFAIIDTSDNIPNYHIENSISIYPNPAINQAVIEISNFESLQKVENIEIYDVFGKLLQTVPVSSKKTHFDVSNLTSGVYFIKVKIEYGVVTKKFIKR